MSSIIVAAAPIFTAILAHFAGEERFSRRTLLGFLIAFTGVISVVFNGAFVLKSWTPGAICWHWEPPPAGRCTPMLLRRMGGQHDPLLVTRRTLFWGTVTAVPIVLLEGAPFPCRTTGHAGYCRESPVSGTHRQRTLLCALEPDCPAVRSGLRQQFHLPHSLRHHRSSSPLFWRRPSLPLRFWAPPSSPQALWVTQRETPLFRRPAGCRSH